MLPPVYLPWRGIPFCVTDCCGDVERCEGGSCVIDTCPGGIPRCGADCCITGERCAGDICVPDTCPGGIPKCGTACCGANEVCSGNVCVLADCPGNLPRCGGTSCCTEMRRCIADTCLLPTCITAGTTTGRCPPTDPINRPLRDAQCVGVPLSVDPLEVVVRCRYIGGSSTCLYQVVSFVYFLIHPKPLCLTLFLDNWLPNSHRRNLPSLHTTPALVDR
jgi:hypothetical protein